MKKLLLILLAGVALFAADPIRRAPGFAIPDANGEVRDLADYRGKVVLIEFMQTTCPHCATFAQKMLAVQQKYGDRIQLLAIVFPPDDQNSVKQYIAGHKITYPVLFDCGQVGYSYIRKQTVDFPAAYLIDRNGMIRNDWVYSPMTRDIFEGNGLMPEVDRLMGAAAPALAKSAPPKK